MENTLRNIINKIEIECRIEQSEEKKKRLKRQADERRQREEAERRRKLQEEEPAVNIKLQAFMEEGKLTEPKEKENKLEGGESSNGLEHVNEKLETGKKNDNLQRRSKVSLITAINKVPQFADAIRSRQDNNNINQSAIQTVIMVDENVPGQIIPMVFSKLPNEGLPTPHLLTIDSNAMPAVEMLRSLLQTFDASKRIRILMLTLVEQNEKCEAFTHFARTVIKFLNETNYVYELQIVRLASECRQSVLGIDEDGTITNYQLNDIDAKKSNDFIASRIVELFKSETILTYVSKQNFEKNTQSTTHIVSLDVDVDAKQTSELRTSTCDFCRDNVRKYHYSYYGIFIVIFAIPITLLLFDIYICCKNATTK